MPIDIRSTTIIGVIHNGEAALGGDGQVTLGNTVMKHNAMKVRKIANGKVLCGFAGASADAFTLMERFEDKLEQFRGNVNRAAVELAKEWRTDKYLRKLEAMLAVISKDSAFIISGNGDVIEPDDKIVAIGSGGMYALAAAKMLKKYSKLSASEIVLQSLQTASEICIYTNDKIHVETLEK
ncbi:MAG: HslU--HslV peptidase proteolytic subunit [Ignavibacteria bacterium CG_4_8_14_3_um_filter_37_9]|nr:ATP-dependent protease subunit HslV [Ignavibacteria bacterium]OIO13670.1 MAG: HslU--HslV peptidase proteolytic subunit [Ignavibacteria bacterium CG1_02_37_35]PIP77411.1 MAG: HslU--HslV peptidase proteolytic subunit [Ignavibacteria bacterium CG22_combo_CG10-13_8_21_14_all_37_15]PIS44414.1 MAG: HslU--HslV peptidase proteolytic subunit [Ignavibacteria bacterium CG08_land_8_20_14_0_20_37_9]PIX00083.1 MAG: HslU--HslV peptidase proteolytic subunit [Ignavibacteria bacterium CG_4_8_14_3_um_filter_37